jgi:hypothetical protein
MDFATFQRARVGRGRNGLSQIPADRQEIETILEDFRASLALAIGPELAVSLDPWISSNEMTRLKLVLRRIGGANDGLEVKVAVFEIPFSGYPVGIEMGQRKYMAGGSTSLRHFLESDAQEDPALLDLVDEMLSLK